MVHKVQPQVVAGPSDATPWRVKRTLRGLTGHCLLRSLARSPTGPVALVFCSRSGGMRATCPVDQPDNPVTQPDSPALMAQPDSPARQHLTTPTRPSFFIDLQGVLTVAKGKRTFQPNNRRRARVHGFRLRMRTRAGRAIVSARRRKGRAELTA